MKPACELCVPADVVFENPLAYTRYDSNSLSLGHACDVPDPSDGIRCVLKK